MVYTKFAAIQKVVDLSGGLRYTILKERRNTMSYLTLDDGTDAADFDSLYGREWNFIYALEDKIKANTNAGKPPFDGIDFPETGKSIGANTLNFLAKALNKSETFVSAMKTACASKNAQKNVFNFIGKLDFTEVLKDEKNEANILKIIYNNIRHGYNKNLTASTATWAMAYAATNGLIGNYDEMGDETHPYYKITQFDENKEKLEYGSPKALTIIAEKSSTQNIALIKDVLKRSDLSELDDGTKSKLEKMIQYSWNDKRQEEKFNLFLESSPVTNLSEKAFLKRKNITLEDVQTYYDKNNWNKLSPTNLLDKLDYAKENNKIENFTESMNKIRGELAVKYIMETEQVDHNIVNKFSKDICQGFKDNPEALKKLGVEIPYSVIDTLKKDEHFKNDIQFIDGAKNVSIAFTYKDHYEKSIDLLNQVAEKGFSAGYGAEMIVLKAGKVLEEKRSEYELAKKNLQTVLKKREEYNQAKERFDILDMVEQDIGTYLYKDENFFQQLDPSLNKEEILKMAIDKAKGKDVKKLECTDKPTNGLGKLFMSKDKKEKEQKNIKAKEEACNIINQFVESLSSKLKNTETKFEANNPTKLLEDCSIDTVKKQWSEDYEYIQDNRSTVEHSKWTEKDARKLVEEFEKMETAQKSAQTKLDHQVTITKTARETSGVKDIETKTGFDAMEIKAQLRAENPNMPVRDLYASMKEIRDKGEYSAEIKIKTPKDDKVKADNDKLSVLRGTKAQEAKPVKQTSLPQMMKNKSNTQE